MPEQPHGTPVELTSRRPARRRADAERNRTRVLAAAERLFSEHGVEAVTMDAIAAAAGVGKGTLYRGFGDKGGLAVALLSERERELQERMLTGPPPLGLGAGPVDRLVAFAGEYLRLAVAQLDLLLLAENNAPTARHASGAHALWVTHCRHLLVEAGVLDAQIRAEALLAVLSAEQVAYWLREEGRQVEALTQSVRGIAAALARDSSNP